MITTSISLRPRRHLHDGIFSGDLGLPFLVPLLHQPHHVVKPDLQRQLGEGVTGVGGARGGRGCKRVNVVRGGGGGGYRVGGDGMSEWYVVCWYSGVIGVC